MNYYRKYIILAILGSLIIGMASYLFLNNYLDRKEILVAARYIEDGKKIDENDICVKEYYKDSLPEGYLTRKEDVIGKIINLPRRKDDYISIDMLLEKPEEGICSGLGEDEVVLSIN
ncbi:MAG: SAF domain-containing protein, partial [Actinobacteria bacterium]|nr:SAF domain-containing protein [Actinomycetota bacterium]